MMSFIYNHQALSILLGVLVFLVILYLIFKRLPTSVKKKEKKTESKIEKQDTKNSPEDNKKEEEKPEPEVEEKTQIDDKKSKNESKKPKIVQIYKREQREEKSETKPKIDPIYDRNVEFVNTSKTIAKFKSFADEKKEEPVEELHKDEFGFVSDVQDGCEFCVDSVKHFDHSRRLSSVMKDDGYDDMFASHISDKYLNINSEKHLKIDDDFHKALYSRTDDMLSNIDNRFGVNQGESLFTSMNGFEDSRSEEYSNDKVNVNMKTALIADTYFNRKRKK